MTASPMAWIGMLVGCVGLATSIGNMGYTYASVLGRIDTNHTAVTIKLEVLDKEVQRNFTEDKDAHGRSARAIDRIDASMTSFGQIHVKMGVMEAQMASMNETLKEIRQELRRAHSDRRSESKSTIR